MNVLALLALALTAQLSFPRIWPERYQKGCITKLWIRLSPGFLRIKGHRIARVEQIVTGVMICVFFLPPGSLSIWVLLLYLDDYFTGGSDNWRRRWESVRNRIKWKMALPASEAS